MTLKAYEKPDQFKIYLTDIGLVTALYGFETQSSLIKNVLKGSTNSGIYENLIFDVLNINEIYTAYLKKDNSTQEIKFLIKKDCYIVPIEVKSAQEKNFSLSEFIKKFDPKIAYKLTSTNIG